jgi:nucleoside-diphosphate-sugar epimerase
MDVAIAGAHGKIARRLARLLAARGDRIRGLIRNPDHADDVRADGAEPFVCDLEAAGVGEVAAAIEGADTVVFAAGAGSGSGAERKLTMDRDGATKLLEAARAAGVERYVIVSAVGAESPPGGDDVAAVLDAILLEPRSTGRILYVNAGDDSVEDALEEALDR